MEVSVETLKIPLVRMSPEVKGEGRSSVVLVLGHRSDVVESLEELSVHSDMVMFDGKPPGWMVMTDPSSTVIVVSGTAEVEIVPLVGKALVFTKVVEDVGVKLAELTSLVSPKLSLLTAVGSVQWEEELVRKGEGLMLDVVPLLEPLEGTGKGTTVKVM